MAAAVPTRRTEETVRYASRTDVGCTREHNEDSLLAQAPLFVVADGMGGHAAGEVASQIAVQTIKRTAPRHPQADALGRAVAAANQAILDGVRNGEGREGMGTTLTAAMVEGERLIIAQVGDSRAYLLHRGSLQQLTRDHSLMTELIEAGQLTPEEARFHPQRSVITRALGSSPNTVADLYELNVEPGDRLLLCSDGLTSMVEDAVIAEILSAEADLERCVDALIDEACAMGGFDNVTAIVVDIEGFESKRTRSTSRKAKITALLIVCLFIGVIAGAVIGFNSWVNNAAYLADNGGTVAIYRGVPGEVLGREFSELEATSNVKTDDLNAGLAARLKDKGVTADNAESAEQLLRGYAEELKMDDLKIVKVAPQGDASKADEPQKADKTEKAEPSASASSSPAATPEVKPAE